MSLEGDLADPPTPGPQLLHCRRPTGERNSPMSEIRSLPPPM